MKVLLATLLLGVSFYFSDAAEPCMLLEGSRNGTILKYVPCEDRCVNTTTGLFCSPQICDKFMDLRSPDLPNQPSEPIYTIGFCNGSTDFDCREHLVTEGLEPAMCDTEEAVCPRNQTCQRGYHFINPYGRSLGDYAMCGAPGDWPVLPASYVLCGHVEFMPPALRAAYLLEQQQAAAAEAAEAAAAAAEAAALAAEQAAAAAANPPSVHLPVDPAPAAPPAGPTEPPAIPDHLDPDRDAPPPPPPAASPAASPAAGTPAAPPVDPADAPSPPDHLDPGADAAPPAAPPAGSPAAPPVDPADAPSPPDHLDPGADATP